MNDRKKKWVSKVKAFDFDIEYKKGKMNVVLDAISIKPTLSFMKFPADWKSQLAVEYSKNQFACEILDGMIHNDAYNIINCVI